jgi:NAD(P)-dependent dehydrogenase (short-subunit alcohol dehydrogenase family)
VSGFALSLAGKSALVTGAFGGLGRHFALTLAAAGARVALAGRRVTEGEKVVRQIAQAGGEAVVVPLDVTDAGSVAAAVDQAAQALGPLTVLINNAGVAVTKPALEQTEEDWQSVMEVNLNGAWRVAQAMARHMKAHGQGGSIVNIASVLGLRVSAQVPAYVASKAGLIHLTKALALELARHRIRVNALAPGYIETDLNRDFFATEAGQAVLKRIPQRRLGRLEHLDGPLLLLASDASEFMTGSTLVVDGGQLVNTL